MDYQEVIELLKSANRSNDMVGILPKSDISKVIISAMRELQEYKQLGALEEVREAVEKQEEERPQKVLGIFGGEEYECRECGNTVEYMDEYCRYCGQKQDWE